MNIKRIPYILIPVALFILFTLPIYSQKVQQKTTDTIVLTGDKDYYPLGKFLYIMKSRKKTMTVDEATSSETSALYNKNMSEVPNYGFSDSDFWVRFTVKNNSGTARKWLLVLAYPHLDKIEIFKHSSSGTAKIAQAGDIYPFDKRIIKHRDFIFELPVDAGSEEVFYIRFSGKCSKQFPLAIWSHISFISQIGVEKFGLGIYYGIMLVMILYNLFIFTSVRDKSYLFYVIYIFAYALVQMAYNGLAFRHLWPGFPYWHSISLPFLIGTTVFFMALFSKTFLNLKESVPVLNKLLITIMGLSAVVVIISIFGSYILAIKMAMILMVLAAILIMLSGFFCFKKGFRPARFFLIAWISFLCGMIIIALKTLGVLPSMFITEYGIQIGSALEVTLLSLALADRINVLQQEKQDSQKMASLGQMASSIVHDLKNPLGIIKGYAEMAVDDSFEQEEREEFLDTVSQEVDRLNDMIFDILDYSKGDLQLNKQSINIEKYLMEICRYIEPYFTDKKIELELKVHDKELVNIDPDRFRRVVFNIANNAADAMTASKTEDAKLLIEFFKEEENSVILFTDNGPGIPKEIQDTLFIPFISQGKAQGTGLGMAIAKNIVESHNGNINFTTTDKKGTIFKIILNDS